MAKKQNIGLYTAVFLLSVVIFISVSSYFDFVQDDAFITFRYAENFISGQGLVFNTGERIEGYTNFFWLLLIIIGRLLNLDPILFPRILGMMCGVLTLFILYKLSGLYFKDKNVIRSIPPLVLSTMLSFGYWAGAGLETALFTLCFVFSVYAYEKQMKILPVILALATMVRPEGFLIFIMLTSFGYFSNKRMRNYYLLVASLYIILLAPFFAFKLFYFGRLLPNTFYAKAGFTLNNLSDGLEYLLRFLKHYYAYGLILVPAIVVAARKSLKGRLLLFITAIYFLYIMFIGGDVLKVHRLFVPLMPLLALLTVVGFSRLFKNRFFIFISVVFVISWQILIPYKFISDYFLAEQRLVEKMKTISARLSEVDKTNFSIAVSTIGAISYYLPKHTVIDLLGLTDSTIALHPEEPIDQMATTWKERKFNNKYLLSRQPDYIMFSTGSKPSAPAEKALFLYSAFLKSYRTITFEREGSRSDIFKRYYSVSNNISRDISPDFIKYYYLGLEHKIAGRYKKAINSFDEALTYIPDSLYCLARYYKAECDRLQKKHPESYRALKALETRDSLTYEVYKDLYTYEYLAYKNYERAEYYRDRIKKLMPWYVKSLDAKVMRWDKD